jgi:hypothetical protein
LACSFNGASMIPAPLQILPPGRFGSNEFAQAFD